MASATLDVTETLSGAPTPVTFASADQTVNVEVHYLDRDITVPKGKFPNEFYTEMLKLLVEVFPSSTGDVLIMLPGKEEIGTMVGHLESRATFAEVKLCVLHSQLGADEIREALLHDPHVRKILCATDMVQNAITIDGLNTVIVSGYHKLNTVDAEGIQQLVLTKACKSNLKQCLGRAGRQGVRGHAYLMMTQLEYDRRMPYAENEVRRNPLYLQLIKLLNDRLPVEEILSHLDPYRIRGDLEFLIQHGALLKVDGSRRLGEGSALPQTPSPQPSGTISVTELGRIMAQLPLSIRSAHLVALAALEDRAHYVEYRLYLAALVAVWIDQKSSIFFQPTRKPREDESEFLDRKMLLVQCQEEVYKKDCLATMLHVWSMRPSKRQFFHEWCLEHGLFERVLKGMETDLRHLLGALESLGFKAEIPERVDDVEEDGPSQLPLVERPICLMVGDEASDQDLDETAQLILPFLQTAFLDWTFTLEGGSYKRELRTRDTYLLDRYVGNKLVKTRQYPNKCLALSLRKVREHRVTLTNVVAL